MVNVSIEGVREAIETVRDVVTPWWRKNAQRKANLESALRQAEIQRLNGETHLAEAKAQREVAAARIDSTQATLILSQAKKTEAEARLILAKSEKIRVEVEKERTVLRQSQIEVAILIVDRFAPDLGGTQKMDYVVKILPILDRLISSQGELELLSSGKQEQ